MEAFAFRRAGDALIVHAPLAPHQPITTLDEWRVHGKPFAGDAHWADSYSAKEVAKAWLRDGSPAVPAELAQLFASHQLTRKLIVATAVPELVTPLRVTRGGGRHHDLVLFGESGGRKVVVGIEAKTDELLDDLLWVRVARVWENEIRRGKATAQVERLQRLCESLFGRPLLTLDSAGAVTADADLADLPYQLFSGVAGTLIEAAERGADLAVFVVHGFSCPSFDAAAVADNDAGICAFFTPLLTAAGSLEPGILSGPLRIPASAHIPEAALLAGSITTPIPAFPEHRRVRPSPAMLTRLRKSYEEALHSRVLAEAVRTRTLIPARSNAAGEAAL